MRIGGMLAWLGALVLSGAMAQSEAQESRSLRLEVASVHDSLSFTSDWWGESDPHYWISTEGDPRNLLRFEGLDVPKGARIDRARLTVWSFNAAADDPGDYVTVWLEATDDAAPVTGPAEAWARMSEGGGREARWPTVTPGRDRPQSSPDLAALLQEIVSRPGWRAGNAVLFFARATASPAHDGRQMHSYYTGTAGATRPILEVEYSTGPTSVRAALEAQDRFATFVRALRATGRWDALSRGGPTTVFAPTEAAFASLPEGALEALFEDPEALARFVDVHLVRDDVIVAANGRLLDDGSINPLEAILPVPQGRAEGVGGGETDEATRR